VTLTYLELDLDVFAGPFDLLLTLILREEVDLLEVDLAEVVIAYIDHLERKGELDLEAATEFLVLIAALLELKSRLLLPGEEVEELELDPGEAAEELLDRLLAAQRYRTAAGYLSARLDEEAGYRFRSAPLPPQLRKTALRDAGVVYDPAILASAIGSLLQVPPPVDVRHMTVAKVTVAERLAHLRKLLRAGRFTFSEAVGRADRVTVAVTLYALLELYKQGEATWVQNEPFAEIMITGMRAQERRLTA
jgi:segregation and condensation protein A